MKNRTKTVIELFWAFVAGLIFSMLPRLFASGQKDVSDFDISRWLDYDFFDFGRYGTFDEFLFGFVTTYLVILSVKKYRSANL